MYGLQSLYRWPAQTTCWATQTTTNVVQTSETTTQDPACVSWAHETAAFETEEDAAALPTQEQDASPVAETVTRPPKPRRVRIHVAKNDSTPRFNPVRAVEHTPELYVHNIWLNTLHGFENHGTGGMEYVQRLHYFPSSPKISSAIIKSLVEYFNGCISTVYKATYADGCIFVRVPTFDHNRVSETASQFGCTNVLLPKLTTLEFYFLVASTDTHPIACEPIVTRGGLCTLMLTYSSQCTPAHTTSYLEAPIADLVMIPFQPHNIIFQGTRFITSDDIQLFPEPSNTSTSCQVSTTQNGDTILIVVEDLVWERTPINSNGRRRLCHFVAWFELDWPGEPITKRTVWNSCQNVKYRRECVEFGINIERIYVKPKNRILACVRTSSLNRIPPSILKKIPTSTAFYMTIRSNRARPGPRMDVDALLMFSRNPKLFFIGDAINIHCHTLNEPNLRELKIVAPYDIAFHRGTHTLRLDITYTFDNRRQFLISGLPGNDDYHVHMQVWEPNTDLRVQMWSNANDLIIARSSPIAVLYCMSFTEGQLCNTSVFKRKTRSGQRFGYIGDMKLPNTNFFIYDI
uniref:Protein UL31 n=1 Tax=Hipposideros bat herpesvirus TaxID=3141919 RepID=A0AAU7E1S8_9VIRU